jgi:predicted enzyme related to lactoylglutathione lyase
MSDLPKPAVVVFAKDLARVARFYEGVAAMTFAHRDADHVVLDSERMQIVVHAIPRAIAEGIEIADPPARREDTPIKLCLPVASIARARAIAARLGGKLDAPDREWQARGFRACDGHDPEGNVVQLRERAV